MSARACAQRHRHQKDHWADPLSETGLSGSADPDCTCRTQPADDAVKPRLVRSREAQTPPTTGRSCSLFTMCKIAGGATRAAPANPLTDIPDDFGGARRDRTDDLMLAKHALSQLSYGPSLDGSAGPKVRKAERPPRLMPRTVAKRHPKNGGPGTTRTSDLTLIRGAL